VPGVSDAVVNLATEKATVTYDPGLGSEQAFIDKIRAVGYDVPVAAVELPLQRAPQDGDATALAAALRAVEGVLGVELRDSQAVVQVVTGLAGFGDLAAAAARAGFPLAASDGEAEDTLEDAERQARRAEVADQTRKFWVGVAFTLPLFVLSMTRDAATAYLGMHNDFTMALHAPWVNWLFFVLATPVQVYTGGDYYVGATKPYATAPPIWTC
jgi:Cu+-exporting ATPase